MKSPLHFSKILTYSTFFLFSVQLLTAQTQAPKKEFSEKLDGISTSSKQLLKDAGTDKSSIGQSGQMTTSVPLVTVTSRTLQFPLSLYYASGIKVDQISGPVGLGWALPIGSIVRDYGAYEPDYSSTAHESAMLSWQGNSDYDGKLATGDGSEVDPFAHRQYLGYDAIKTRGASNPVSDKYHVSVPGYLSNTFWNGGEVKAAHDWKWSEIDNLMVSHTTKTFTISQEFSRINETNIDLTTNNEMAMGSSYAAAIGVYPYVIDGFAKIPTSGSEHQFNPQGDEKVVRYEDFETFVVTDANGVVYEFGRPLRGQKYVFNNDPYWSNKESTLTGDGSFWKIDYIAEWLLTEIRSADYEDVNRNGKADEGDAGDWVRFEYTEPTKTEQTVLIGGSSTRLTQEVPTHRTWSGFSQTDQASSLMREVAYLTKIVTPLQEIDFTISERYDVEHDYYTKPANKIANDYYFDSKLFGTNGSATDFDIKYPVETMKYDTITVKSKLINTNLYPNEKDEVSTIVLNYAAKGSAQEMAVSSYLIRNNDKNEKIVGGQPVGKPGYAVFNAENYYSTTQKRGKTTLLGVDFYGTVVSPTEKNSYTFDYAYNPSFDEIHKREIARLYFFPSLRQGISASANEQPFPDERAATPFSYVEKRLNTNGTSYTNQTHSTCSPYDLLIDIPYSEIEYKLNTDTQGKMDYASSESTELGSHTLLAFPLTHPLAPVKDIYGYLYGSEQSAQAWSLTKITYPTGGQVTFEYEAGSFTPSDDWSMDADALPVISQYNAIAKQRSWIQDAHNVAMTFDYGLTGLPIKRLTATLEIDLEENYGIRLRKKTINDRINPPVVIKYEYEDGQLTALPSEYLQSYYGAFHQFVVRQNFKHSIELDKYTSALNGTGWAYDYATKMSALTHTGISLDDYSSTFFYSTVQTDYSDNSFTQTHYGSSDGEGIDYPVYDLFCYRQPSADWQGCFTLAGDNFQRKPIVVLSEEAYAAGTTVPMTSTTYEYDFVTSDIRSVEVQYGGNDQVELWDVDFEIWHPGMQGSNPVYNYITTQLNASLTLPFAGHTNWSYQRWGSCKLLSTKRTTNYKGMVSTAYYTYDPAINYMLREEKSSTQNEPNVYFTRHVYAFEQYGGLFTALNMKNVPYRTTTYLESVADANALSASVLTYDLSGNVPHLLDSYVFETTAVDPETGTFTLQPFSTSNSLWRISEADIYEYNSHNVPVSTRSNQVYSKVVRGNNTLVTKAQFSGINAPFDATYTGFEDLHERLLIDEWHNRAYLDEIWLTNELTYAEESAVIVHSQQNEVCTHNSTFTPSGLSEAWNHVVTADNTIALVPGDEVDFTFDYQGNTTVFTTTVEAIYPETVLSAFVQASADAYVVCFSSTPPIPSVDPMTTPLVMTNISLKKHIKNYRLSSSYARTGKYSYKLPTLREELDEARQTPIRPVKLPEVNTGPECHPTGEGPHPVIPACYHSYEASVWLRYDNDIAVANANLPAYTGQSVDTEADQLYRRGANVTSTQGIRIVCDVWNADRTQLLDQKTYYPGSVDASWKQYTVNLDIEKGEQKWLDVYVLNDISQRAAISRDYKSVFVDDILVYPTGAKYGYTVIDPRGNTTFAVDNNDVFTETVYDNKGRVLNVRNAYGKVVSEATYFDQPNWTTSQNYVTERAWTSTGYYHDTRYYLDGFGKTKQAMLADGVRGTRMVSETNVYDDRGRVIQSWKPYVLSGATLTTKYDAGFQTRDQQFYGSSYAYSSMTYEATPMEKPSSATAPRMNAENAITATQTDAVTTATLTAPAPVGGRVYNAGTLMVYEKTDPMGKKVRSYLDNLGRVVMEEHEIGNDHQQNTDGSISVLSTGYATARTWFQYDGAGRIVSTLDPDGKQSFYTYNSLGLVVKSISPDKGTSEMRYDKYGQVRFVRNARDLEAMQNNTDDCDQFKYMKYDKWGRVTESGVLTVSPVAQNSGNPFPTTNFFDSYTHINNQAFPASGQAFVQIHTKSVYDGPRSEYKGTALLSQTTYSGHTFNSGNYTYSAGKTDVVSTLPTADGQVAKTTYQYDGLAGQHDISVEYNAYRIPIRKKYTSSVNSAYNFTWETELDNLGRPRREKTIHNSIAQQHAQHYYDALGNLMMTGVGMHNSAFADVQVIKMNIRNQVVSQMSHFLRIGLSYNANGNITAQTWSNALLENNGGNTLNVNRYDYYYDGMNRLIGADYKQTTMSSDPFAYFEALTDNVPDDFSCFVSESEVALALAPIFEEIEENALNFSEKNITDMTNALSYLQALYVSNNKAYQSMTAKEKNDFLDNFAAQAVLNNQRPELLELFFATKDLDTVYQDSLLSKDYSTLSKKYVRWILSQVPYTPPVDCYSNATATVYGYLPNFVQPTFSSNTYKYDMAYWYSVNGNLTQLNRNDELGVKTVQEYSYANVANNRLTGVTWTVGALTPFTHNYTYDATGNLLSDPRNSVSAISYSAYDDLPQQIVNSTAAYDYRYFGGQRSVKVISSTDREYYLVGMVLTQAGEVKSYQTTNGYAIPDGSGGVEYFYNIRDWLGTNRAVISEGGQAVNALDTDPYGKNLPGRQLFNSNYEGYRYQFTGHETDGETGYQYHGARYYAEELGRYMGVDPLATNYAGWSTYNYTMANPVMLVDPSGMGPEGWIKESGSNTWTWDEGVTSEAQAIEKYGEGTKYLDPGSIIEDCTIGGAGERGAVYAGYGPQDVHMLSAGDAEAMRNLKTFVQPRSQNDLNPLEGASRTMDYIQQNAVSSYSKGDLFTTDWSTDFETKRRIAAQSKALDEFTVNYVMFWFDLAGAGEMYEAGRLLYYGGKAYLSGEVSRDITRQFARNTVREFESRAIANETQTIYRVASSGEVVDVLTYGFRQPPISSKIATYEGKLFWPNKENAQWYHNWVGEGNQILEIEVNGNFIFENGADAGRQFYFVAPERMQLFNSAIQIVK